MAAHQADGQSKRSFANRHKLVLWCLFINTEHPAWACLQYTQNALQSANFKAMETCINHFMPSPTVIRFKRVLGCIFTPIQFSWNSFFSGSLIWGSLKWSFCWGRCWSSWQLSSLSAATAFILRVSELDIGYEIKRRLMSQMQRSIIPILRLAGQTPQLTGHLYLDEPSSMKQQGSNTSARCADPKKMPSRSQWKEIQSIPRKLARSTLCFR